MYKLYWARNSGALGPQILLEEAGIPHEIVPVDFRVGDNKKPEYLAINPIGYIPSLECADGSIVYEAAAIMMFLAEEQGLDGLVPPPGHERRGLFLRSLFFMSGTIQYLYHIFYNPDRYSPDPADAPKLKDQALASLRERWSLVDAQLRDNGPYMLGDADSMLDIYMLMLVTWFPPRDSLLTANPALRKCFELTAARPVVHKLLIEHEIAESA